MYHCDPKLIDEHHDPINAPFAAEALTSAVTDHGDKDTNFEALHRWTGMARLLVLDVTSDSLRSRLFSSGKATVDISQAKLLLSACRIAVHNTACKLPIFIRCGLARHNLFIGYSLSKDQNQDITESNFNTMVVPSLPSTWSDLDIVRRVLRKKLEIDEYDGGKLFASEYHSCRYASWGKIDFTIHRLIISHYTLICIIRSGHPSYSSFYIQPQALV
jgi:hypothetical protein